MFENPYERIVPEGYCAKCKSCTTAYNSRGECEVCGTKVVDLPQAPETTEILNEVKADKGILTEEELKERNRLLVLENDEQTALLKKAGDFIDSIMSFYGQNLMVMGWHQNGDGEPFDNFIDDNLDETLLDELNSALEELK